MAWVFLEFLVEKLLVKRYVVVAQVLEFVSFDLCSSVECICNKEFGVLASLDVMRRPIHFNDSIVFGEVEVCGKLSAGDTVLRLASLVKLLNCVANIDLIESAVSFALIS